MTEERQTSSAFEAGGGGGGGGTKRSFAWKNKIVEPRAWRDLVADCYC